MYRTTHHTNSYTLTIIIILMDVILHEKSMHAGAHLIGAPNNVDLYPLISATII